MAEAVLSVCWKDHTSELASVYKSLLKNNFLVDCSLSAEGQSLKAHRLVLSACSPYFHMLFREETGKHPIIIFFDASFEALKSVIDFVYRGETQIPEGNLKAFLALAQSLQIKGLNGFSKQYKNKYLSDNTAGNVHQGPCEDTKDICEVQSGHKNGFENYSQQHPHHSDNYSNPMNTISSLSFEGYNGSCEEVQAPQECQKPDEVRVDSEISMKHEPLFAEFSETSVKSNEHRCGNFTTEIDGGTASVFGERNLNQYSNCSESSHGNVNSSAMPPSQLQHRQLSDNESSGRDVAEEDERLLPVILVPKSECMDEVSGETVDDHGVPGSYTNEAEEVTEFVCDGQNLNQSLRAVSFPPEDLTTERGSQSSTLLLQPELQRRESRLQDSGEKAILRQAGRKALPRPSNLHSQRRAHPGERPFLCGVCGDSFDLHGRLATHMRKHMGERPFRCDVCGMTFKKPHHLSGHMRTHTGERPFRCDVCGKRFTAEGNLTRHKRVHTGERPFGCDVCGKAFSDRTTLRGHKQRHAKERQVR